MEWIDNGINNSYILESCLSQNIIFTTAYNNMRVHCILSECEHFIGDTSQMAKKPTYNNIEHQKS
jgi:hypothetical protein